MLGLSLICSLASPIQEQLPALLRSCDEVRDGGVAPSIIWRDSHLILLASGYPEYPITVHETPGYQLCVEGRVYEAAESPWHQSLAAISEEILAGEPRGVSRAARWIEGTDGEFVWAIQDRHSHDAVIINDFLGRLPLYLYRSGETVVVSRDLAFVVRACGRTTFDRLAVAEHLLYGYPLGPRTLFSGIERVAGATAIQIRRRAKEIIVSNLVLPSVASDVGLVRGKLKDTARELSSAFARACVTRVATGQGAALGLSGGLDSRSVAAGLSGSRHRLLAVTCSTGPGDAEARIAAMVAAVLRLNWRAVPISPPSGSDLLRLLRLKAGMNYLGMAFLLPYFESLQKELGSGTIYLTGDGGDKTLPDHRPRIRVPNMQTLLDYVLARNQVFPLSTVVALTGIPRPDILGALEARIASYPEHDLEEKYVHFVLFERAFKWLFEGEDRNRHFFWSTSPFYGREFFVLAMRCPGLYKANYALYRLFMEALSPNLVDVESTTCGPSLRLERYPIRQLVRQLWKLAPPPLKRGRRELSQPRLTKEVRDCLREQFAVGSPVTDYLSPANANGLLGNLGRTQSNMLLTLTSAIEIFTTGRSTLDRYRDAAF